MRPIGPPAGSAVGTRMSLDASPFAHTISSMPGTSISSWTSLRVGPPEYGRSMRNPIDDRSTARPLASLPSMISQHRASMSMRGLSRRSRLISLIRKFSAAEGLWIQFLVLVPAVVGEPGEGNLGQEHGVGHGAIEREPADVERVDIA